MAGTCNNYYALYKSILDNYGTPSKRLDMRSFFRRKCDCCMKTRYMTAGNVYEFSFYCKVCCNKPLEKCDCGTVDVLAHNACIKCINQKKKNDMPQHIIDKHFCKCSICAVHSFVLYFDNSDEILKVCNKCIVKPINCANCKNPATILNPLCYKCIVLRDSTLVNNYYYVLKD
jgi:hypothetical protein